MTLKRKRSADDSPLSVSSFSTIQTPDALSPLPFPHSFDGAMDLDAQASTRNSGWDFASASRVKNNDWGNRTRKRFRDNRPDEQSIHENTLQKLFAAQRQHPNASPVPSDSLSCEPALAVSRPQKSTLHSFWKQLPAPPVQPPMFAMPTTHVQPLDTQLPRCEDCDASLQSGGDSMDIDMGGAVESNTFACSDCGKNVCATCAVVSTRRHCLQCATSGRNSRRWW